MDLEERIIELFSGNNFTYKLYGEKKWIKLYEREIKIIVLVELGKLIPDAVIVHTNVYYNYFEIQWK